METPDPDPLIGLLTVVLQCGADPHNFLTGFTVNAIIGLVVLCLLLIISALISSSETAFFSLQPADIDELEQRGDAKSKLALTLREKPKTLLATILIGNNLINIMIVIVLNFAMNQMFTFNNAVANFLVQTVILTFLILLFGEVIPKLYATNNNVKFATFVAPALQAMQMSYSMVKS